MGYVAIYMEGRRQPCGAIRASMAEGVIQELNRSYGGRIFSYQPLTRKQAEKIKKAIIGPMPEGLERKVTQRR